jgi:hypothetical protein
MSYLIKHKEELHFGSDRGLQLCAKYLGAGCPVCSAMITFFITYVKWQY